ncbi:anthranilate/aminodeoxychorismate synthase component II [Candidatus Poribacteria bacterium]|nr:anthranilate/aminodeoxychorismate synthase component II [Candidatus Poribacteria bacterium]
MVLMIDNYDSFTYNLVQYFGELGADLIVYRNDKISISQVNKLDPEKIIISPGPCTPNEAGISCQLIRDYAGRVPILGVCLGHQCIGQVFGGNIVRANRLMHGKTSPIYHKNREIFQGLPSPFDATRYHSLIIQNDSLPDCLELTAWTDEEEIMGIQHKEMSIYGVQFHPESILTIEGKKLLGNFLSV